LLRRGALLFAFLGLFFFLFLAFFVFFLLSTPINGKYLKTRIRENMNVSRREIVTEHA
jgi:hypothetical protein